METLKARLQIQAKALGADLCKVADLELLRGIGTNPADLLEPYARAVSLAMALDDAELEGIVDAPTPRYADHYRAVNKRLAVLVEGVAGWLREQGFSALALAPTTENFDPVRCVDQLSHKAVAVAAGIGWQGKSVVTVSPEFGPRMRLVTVLTDAPLPVDGPVRNRCGGCTACTDACPVQAIKNVNTTWHYASRDEALHFERCRHKLMEEFKPRPGISASVCGVCLVACPWGRRRAKAARAG